MRLLCLIAAILFFQSVVHATDYSVTQDAGHRPGLSFGIYSKK
jgi:hypothetical protein